jgi:hypothetical protein
MVERLEEIIMPRGVYPRKKRKKDLFAKRVAGADKAIPDSSIPKGVITHSKEVDYKIDQLLSDLELVRKVVKQGLLPESIMGDIAAACRIAIRQVVSRKLMS